MSLFIFVLLKEWVLFQRLKAYPYKRELHVNNKYLIKKPINYNENCKESYNAFCFILIKTLLQIKINYVKYHIQANLFVNLIFLLKYFLLKIILQNNI